MTSPLTYHAGRQPRSSVFAKYIKNVCAPESCPRAFAAALPVILLAAPAIALQMHLAPGTWVLSGVQTLRVSELCLPPAPNPQPLRDSRGVAFTLHFWAAVCWTELMLVHAWC